MQTNIHNKIPLYHFESFLQVSSIQHFITTRNDGVSLGNYSSFNMGFGTDDNAESVMQNRHILAKEIEVSIDNFVFPRQTHSDNVVVVTEADKGKGVFTKEDAIANTDALITNQKGICICTQVADCVPVLLYDPVKKAIAAIHAGWRGTVADIVGKSVKAMQTEFGSDAANILAGIGPSIGPCCYEVGFEVYDQFMLQIPDEMVADVTHNKPKLNLWDTNKNLLMKAGLLPKNIETACLCTLCNHEMFYSSRHYNGDTGRFVAGIMLL